MSQRKFVCGVVICSSVFVLAGGPLMADTVDIQAFVNGAPAPSQTMDVHLTSAVLGDIDVDAYAGQINWDQGQVVSGTIGSTISSTSSLLADLPFSGPNGTFSTYCIDIVQDIAVNGGPYDYDGLTADLENTPVVSAAGYEGMGPTAAAEVANLYANEYTAVSTAGSLIQYDSNPIDTDANQADQDAAFQVAMWQIIYGTSGLSVADSSNPFYVSNNGTVSTQEFNEITGMADRFVTQAATATGTLNGTLLALTDETLQDQLIVGNPSIAPSTTVPLPTAAMAGAALLGGLAVHKRLRRAQ